MVAARDFSHTRLSFAVLGKRATTRGIRGLHAKLTNSMPRVLRLTRSTFFSTRVTLLHYTGIGNMF